MNDFDYKWVVRKIGINLRNLGRRMGGLLSQKDGEYQQGNSPLLRLQDLERILVEREHSLRELASHGDTVELTYKADFLKDFWREVQNHMDGGNRDLAYKVKQAMIHVNQHIREGKDLPSEMTSALNAAEAVADEILNNAMAKESAKAKAG
jgi:hypothetical protein